MAKLWGGRFENETDQDAFLFNASISFDQRMIREDIKGSIAHAHMLGECGIIPKEDSEKIVSGLNGILNDIDSGDLEIDETCEDVHSFVESVLTERIGEAGKKLHTGRSRNDQVALDMKLHIRNEIIRLDERLYNLEKALFIIIRDNTDSYMPGFTHLQKAQPVSLSHHMGAYFEMFIRDRRRLKDIYASTGTCPLGSGALAGTTYPLDRDMTAAELLFTDGPTRNSMDSVSDRDYLIEFLSALSTIMMHLSRFSEEIIIWNSNEYSFVEIDDRFSTGSSIMPQKKNPDIAELVRGKTGRVYGALMSILTTMKGLPLAYDKDMQEDKEVVFDAIETVDNSLKQFTGMVETLKFNREIMERSAMKGFTNATDAADYLVKKGMPFRDAHSVTGRLVLKCIAEGKTLNDLSLSEWKEGSDLFDEDIYDAVSLKTCVESRITFGAPGKGSMDKIIGLYEDYLKSGSMKI